MSSTKPTTSINPIEKHVQTLPYDLDTIIELMIHAKQDFSLREPSRFEQLLGFDDSILSDIEEPRFRREIVFRNLALHLHKLYDTNPVYEEFELYMELNMLDMYHHNEPEKYDECLQRLLHARFCEYGFSRFLEQEK